MSNWTQALGARLRLVAQPDNMNKGSGTNGDLQIECENLTMMPITFAILSLYSYDPNVATASHATSTPASFNAPRRPNKHSAATPSNTTVKVGLWLPGNQGSTTVGAQVNVQMRSVVNPEDDVQVK